MKRIYSIILLLLSTIITGYAQFTKGTILLGGASDFEIKFNTSSYQFPGSNTVTNGRTTSFTLIPQMAYFFADNIAAGAGITLGSATFKPDDGGNKTSTTSFTFSPFGRYYFSNFYGQLSFDVGTMHTEFSNNSTSDNTITGWSLLGGYALKLNETVTFEPQLGYASTTSKDDGDTKRFNAGLFIRAGIFVYLARK